MAQIVQEHYEAVILVRSQQAEDQAQRQYDLQHTQYKVGDCRYPVTHIGTTLISIFNNLHTILDPVARRVYIAFALALRIRTAGSIRPSIGGRNRFGRLILPLHSWLGSVLRLFFTLAAT